MQFVNNNIKIRPTTPDGILSPGQVASMTENVAKKYNWIQFDILEVKSVVLDEEEQENPNLYGAITGRMVTTQYNQSLDGEYILPFSLRDFEPPNVNEHVLVFEYVNPGNPPGTAAYYYIRNLALGRSLNFNVEKYGSSGYSNINEIDNARNVSNNVVTKDIPLPKYNSGDRFIHGRYGHYIQFTNRDNSPCLRITNGVDEFNEGGLFNPNFNNEGSVIYLDNSPENNPLDLDIRVGGGTPFPKKLTGNQIVIESDRLIFQSKKEEVFISAAKKFVINAPEIVINGHNFVHGEILNDTLKELVKEVNSISTWAVALGYMPGGKPPHPALEFLRNLMKNIFNPRHKGSPWETPKAKPVEPKKSKSSYEKTEDTTVANKYKTEPRIIARVMKVIGETFINDKIAKPGDPVFPGDKLKTGKGAFMALIYLNDKSVIKVQENYSFMMADSARNSGLGQKMQDITRSQIDEKGYMVETSVSVASVKG
jgi:hypothetical protein